MNVSITAPECQACERVNDCDNKRMAACAYMALPTAASMARETVSVNMGDISGTIYRDDLEKMISKSLYGCAFDVMKR